MNPISTETFPYTIAYVCELLKLDEPRVLALCNTLGIQPHRDDRSGRLFFSIKDVDNLRKAVEAEKHRASSGTQVPQRIQQSTPTHAAKSGYSSVPQTASGAGLSRADLSVIVDAVSNAKEGILRDLSQLLDDKLSGLDDVVVELIRSKSENDSLREQLKRLEESRDQYQSELSRYKPAAFGFYRKEG